MTSPVKAPMGYVRGVGTTTWEQDKADKQLALDTARRRAQADKQARQAQVTPDEAKIYTNNLGGANKNPAVVLAIRAQDGSVNDWMICEVADTDLDGVPDVTVQLVCPKCAITHNKGQSSSQIKLHRSRHPFEFDRTPLAQGGVAGMVWHNPKDPTQTVHIAGLIDMGDTKGSCPVCHWRFTIFYTRERNGNCVNYIQGA